MTERATQPQFTRVDAVDGLVVVALSFGLFISQSILVVIAGFPSGAVGFSDGAMLGLLLEEAVLASATLGYLYWRGYPLRELVCQPTAVGGLQAVGLLVAAWLASQLAMALCPDSDYAQQPIAQMVAGVHISVPVALLVSAVNGLYEETFLNAYLLKATRPLGLSMALGLNLLVRMLYHVYQGPMGTVAVLAFGAVLSLYYWRTGKLWPVVFAHMLADFIAFT